MTGLQFIARHLGMCSTCRCLSVAHHSFQPSSLFLLHSSAFLSGSTGSFLRCEDCAEPARARRLQAPAGGGGRLRVLVGGGFSGVLGRSLGVSAGSGLWSWLKWSYVLDGAWASAYEALSVGRAFDTSCSNPNNLLGRWCLSRG